MSLQVAGRVMAVREEHVDHGQGWTETRVSVLTGRDSIERVTLGKNFPGAITEGEDVVLVVMLRVFTKKDGGTGYGLTAVDRADADAVKRPAVKAV